MLVNYIFFFSFFTFFSHVFLEWPTYIRRNPGNYFLTVLLNHLYKPFVQYTPSAICECKGLIMIGKNLRGIQPERFTYLTPSTLQVFANNFLSDLFSINLLPENKILHSSNLWEIADDNTQCKLERVYRKDTYAKEKLFATSNFSFSHVVFLHSVCQGREIALLIGKVFKLEYC